MSSLHIAEAGHIRNSDLHAAHGKDRERLESIIRDAHFAWRAAESAQRAYQNLAAQKASVLDVLLGNCAAMIGIDFGALDRAKATMDALIDEHGECCIEMTAVDVSLTSIHEHVIGTLALVEPLRKLVKKK